MTVPAPALDDSAIIESVLLKGDLAKLSADERVRYYSAVCRSLGLNPLTQPFAYITLNARLQLYALRACTDQLRKINGVSIEVVSRDVSDGILTVHVRARLPDGRVDEDLGSVSFPDTLRGDARANAELKAVTKAKRRATLSICGLGWLDETEIESIPGGAKRPPSPAPSVLIPPHDPETGEIITAPHVTAQHATTLHATTRHNTTRHNTPRHFTTRHSTSQHPTPLHNMDKSAGDAADQAASGSPPASLEGPEAATMSIEDMAREAAMRGRETLRLFYAGLDTPEKRDRVKAIKDELDELMSTDI